MTLGWSLFVLVFAVANVAGAGALILWFSRARTTEGATTGHVWDGDVEEGNNPMPRWWLGLFWLTIIWGIVFFVLYPSFGEWSLLGWSQTEQYEDEVAAAEEVYGEIFAAFAATPIPELSSNPAALSAGRNLFVNNCATCHGSDARGARGYPNLADDEWQWGSAPEQIVATITNGRTGVMPGFGQRFDDETIDTLVDYVQFLAGRDVDAARVAAGETQYRSFCSACHGPTGDGNPILGAPAFTNETWLYGGGASVIRDLIVNGRMGQMPAQEPLLGADRVHVLAAYVLSLSGQE
ncbi:MAG: cytochrome-c oxidase, cbb3-type subunit III [Gammaproteobacteria bacterium]|nr:cytochrome-c oxidase, cbb3-type subunit III [Gammaproteobacteria bacterium]